MLKQYGVKPKKRDNYERSLQITSKQWFDYALPDVFGYHVANEMFLGEDREAAVRQIALLKKQGYLAGVHDWMLFWKQDLRLTVPPMIFELYPVPKIITRCAAVELKSPGKNLTPSQEVFRDRWIAIGGLHAVCWNMDDIEAACISFGLKPKYQTPVALERSGRQMSQFAMMDFNRPLDKQ